MRAVVWSPLRRVGPLGGRRALLALIAALLLAGCLPGRPAYTPVTGGVDPYSRLRERAEEHYQAGLAYERAADWRNALRSYEQAMLWDPDHRANIRARADHAREMAAAADPVATLTATPTLRPVQPAGGAAPPPWPATPAATPTRTSTATPTLLPTRRVTATAVRAGYRTYRSQGLRYTIAYPSGWTVKEGTIDEEGARSDTYAGLVTARAAASVVVTGLTLARSTDSEQFYLQVIKELRGEAGFRELPTRQVAGTIAYMVTHSETSGGKTYTAVHAILATGKVGWVITLLAEPASLADARAVFDVIIASFAPDGEVN